MLWHVEKRCTRCGETKETSCFPRNRSRPDGFGQWCKACKARHNAETGYSGRAYQRLKRDEPERLREYQRRARTQYRYGITWDDYEAMLERQGGRCALCGKKHERLYIDHCHTTKRVRGLLCPRCNGNLGWYQKRVAVIAAYLQEPVGSRG